MMRPNGWFVRDMLIFNELGDGGWAAKGYELSLEDHYYASNAQRNDARRWIEGMLRGIRPPARLQVQWHVDSDYSAELQRYDAATEAQAKSNQWSYFHRKERFYRYWEKMKNRQLRREHLRLYIGTPIHGRAPTALTAAGLQQHYETVLGGLQAFFATQEQMLANTIGNAGGKLRALTDADHFRHYSMFLNPSYAERIGFDPVAAGLFDPAESLQANCWHCGIQGGGATHGADAADYGFYLDGYYHNILVLERPPQNPFPGVIRHLTNLSLLDYCITVNCQALDSEGEIRKEDAAIQRLQGDRISENKYSLDGAIDKRKRKVDALVSGYVTPFEIEFIVRVWAKTRDELVSKTAVLKSAIHQMSGARYCDATLPTTSSNLFFQSWPGWLYGSYNYYRLYAESNWLATLLPISSSFTGLLAQAQALYDGDNHSLVGVATFVDGTPQHGAVFGMSGAGKSALMADLLTQTEPFFDYTVIIEEGLSYGLYTRTMGASPIVIHPDADITINYLDTAGLPLTSLHLGSTAGLVARMCGQGGDADRQKLRHSYIEHYLDQLYSDFFTDWCDRQPEALPQLVRTALGVQQYKTAVMPPGITALEAFLEFRDRLNIDDDQAQQCLAAISEAQISQGLTDPLLLKTARNLAFASIPAHDFPIHSDLQQLLELAPSGEHDQAQVKLLAMLLEPWCAHGSCGQLFDGHTNVDLNGRIAHFELGMIPEDNQDLKTLAGFMISSYTRNRILSMPRSSPKRYIFEEVARFLDVEGGEKIVSEGYAQLRKFNCWVSSIVQQYARFRQSRIRPYIMGNSKQFYFLRQEDREDVRDLAADRDLSETTQQGILSHPMPDQLPANDKFASFTYYQQAAGRPLCGVVRNYCCREMLYCAGSNGEQFERRARDLAGRDHDIVNAISDFARADRA